MIQIQPYDPIHFLQEAAEVTEKTENAFMAFQPLRSLCCLL